MHKIHRFSAVLILPIMVAFLVSPYQSQTGSNGVLLAQNETVNPAGLLFSPDESSLPEISKLPSPELLFLENKGQINSADVSYYTDTLAGRVFVLPSGLRYAVQTTDQTRPTSLVPQTVADGTVTDPVAEYLKSFETYVIDESFIGGTVSHPTGTEKTDTKVSSYVGSDPANWQTEIPSYGGVAVGEVWPGILVAYKASAKNIEKVFTVTPHSDPTAIAMHITGAAISIDSNGELDIGLPTEDVSFTKPVAYQEINGAKRIVDVSYALLEDGSYGFTVGEYDSAYPLIIDPLLAATFAGGTTSEITTQFNIDSSGNIYVPGFSFSADFPVTVGAYDTSLSGTFDAFVAKFSSDLTTLLAATYLGGSSTDAAGGKVQFDSSGNVLIVGNTSSADFPATLGAYDTSSNGGSDLFVAKFSSNLATLQAATYIGGAGSENPVALLVDENNKVYFEGASASNNLPATLGAYDTTSNGLDDFMLGRFSADLSSLEALTYYGGTGDDRNGSMVFDGSGNVWIGGGTRSADLPTTAGAYDQTYAADWDVVIAKFSSDFSSLLLATYLGGTGHDDKSVGEFVLFDSLGNPIVVGGTASSNFPTTVGAYDETYNDTTNGDLYVTKFNPTLSSILMSTYIGSAADDAMQGVAITESDEVLIAGITASAAFPVTVGAYDTTQNGSSDGFALKLDSDFESLIASTYFGGNSVDVPRNIMVDSNGNYIIVGYTLSANMPVTAGSYDQTHGGGFDLWLARFSPSLSANDPPSASFNSVRQNKSRVAVEAEVTDNGPDDVVSLTAEYSRDGALWSPATIEEVTVSEGGVTTNNNTIEDIDTDNDGSVTVNFFWNAKTDLDYFSDATVYLRLLPNDGTVDGDYAVSDPFEVSIRPQTGGYFPTPQYISPGLTFPSNYSGNSGQSPTSPTVVPPTVFTRNLSYGSIGSDVLALQRRLNELRFLVASSGPGSPGQETDFYGRLTTQAVVTFQEAYTEYILKPLGLSRGTGFFGPATRAFIQTLP